MLIPNFGQLCCMPVMQQISDIYYSCERIDLHLLWLLFKISFNSCYRSKYCIYASLCNGDRIGVIDVVVEIEYRRLVLDL